MNWYKITSWLGRSSEANEQIFHEFTSEILKLREFMALISQLKWNLTIKFVNFIANFIDFNWFGWKGKWLRFSLRLIDNRFTLTTANKRLDETNGMVISFIVIR